MRLFEFDQPETPDSNQVESTANLITILNQVKGRAEDENTNPSISTAALINMVKNTGIQFDYMSLLDAYENNTAVKSLIKNFSEETVDLAGSTDDVDMDAGQDSGAAIEKIAKRVANRNIG